MATNTFAPFGFRQYQGLGATPTYEQVGAHCNYNTAAMYFGDPVFRNADGSIYPTAPGAVVLAGVFDGCKYLSVSQKRTVWSNYWPSSDVAAGDLVECYITNDPGARFLAQTGGDAVNGLTLADIGANVQFNYGTPTAATGLSGAYIDMAVAPNTTATMPFRVIGLVLDPPGSNGTNAGAYNYAIVAFNNVETKQLTGV